MADVDSSLKNWSTTASSNSPNDNTTIGAGLADNFQQIQATVRADLASKGADIASAATTDLGAVAGHQHDITGAVTITSFGTVAAGIWKIIKFEGVLTLTHNATSLILPDGQNITTAVGDVAIMVSEGSGNWRCVSYQRVNDSYTATLTGCTTAPTGTVKVSRSGNIVSLFVPAFSATSNANTKTLTGMPVSYRPTTSKNFIASISDTGTASVAALMVIGTDGVMTFYTNLDAGIWTSSGTASIAGATYTYALN